MNEMDGREAADMVELWGQDLSGHELDVLGGQAVTPVLIPRPHGPEPCPRKADGRCTCAAGQELCLAFAEEWGVLHHEGHVGANDHSPSSPEGT